MYQSNERAFDKNNTENILHGIVGAFLFSLVGAVLYLLLGMLGFIASISGFAGVACAIKGYSLFAKRETKRGIIISVVIAAIVLIIAWYVGFLIDLFAALNLWFESGEIDYLPSFAETLTSSPMFLLESPGYFIDLVLSLAFGAFGCWTYVKNMLKKQKITQKTVDALAANMSDEDTANSFENQDINQ